MLVLALFAASLQLLMGTGGMASFGHAAYFGIGAYAAALAVKGGVPMEAALALSPLVAAAGALVIGWFCVRLSGVYLAMLTLAFAQIVWSIAFQWDAVTGGSNGIVGVWPATWLAGKRTYYWFALALVGPALAAIVWIAHSPLGYSLRACRDSPLRAEAIGIDVRRTHWIAFALAGAFAGFAGGLYAFSKGSISPETLAIPRSVDALVMVLIGGLNALAGPLLGAAAFTWLSDTLARATEYWHAVLGAIILLIVIAFPMGIGGAIQTWMRRLARNAVGRRAIGEPARRTRTGRHGGRTLYWIRVSSPTSSDHTSCSNPFRSARQPSRATGSKSGASSSTAGSSFPSAARPRASRSRRSRSTCIASWTTRRSARFFAALLTEFSPDPQRVLAASKAYADEPSAANLAKLSIAAEPPRQELLRRLNRAPGGTATILRMRERLLELKRGETELDAVDWDLRHLLSSWFNPGFLRIVRVDWHTPAYVLEQIITHEAVHEIRGWNDLRRRLQADGRCFAFFHPALPDEPLIFLEVALMDRMADSVPPLLDAQSTSGDPGRATTAVFYSINNCQPGLRGVSLGNFLIKNVVDVLSREFPRLKVFCTLSPIPGFAAWLGAQLKQRGSENSTPIAQALKAVDARLGSDIAKIASDPENAVERLAPLKEALTRLCATYLLNRGDGSEPVRDSVARFHLNNGAKLERINWLADVSRKGLRESLGLMVNYLYEPRAIEGNHEQFVNGTIVASRQVRGLALGG